MEQSKLETLFESKWTRQRNFAGKRAGLSLQYEPDNNTYKTCYYSNAKRERMAGTGATLSEAINDFTKKNAENP